ncbi:hypothetical protein V6N13_145881 [Hibiscus sabdariffa]
MELCRINPASGSETPWWHYRAFFDGIGSKIQLGQDDLPQVLCSSAPPCRELQEKEVRTQQSVEAKEEDQVDCISGVKEFYFQYQLETLVVHVFHFVVEYEFSVSETMMACLLKFYFPTVWRLLCFAENDFGTFHGAFPGTRNDITGKGQWSMAPFI